MLEPPFANEGLATRSDVLRRGRIDHVGIVGADFLMQALGRVREQIAVLMNGTALHRHVIPNGGDRSTVGHRQVAVGVDPVR